MSDQPVTATARRLPAHPRSAFLLVGLLLIGVLAAPGCDQGLKIRNAAPRVTAISSVTPQDGTLLVVHWVQDHERDPVDVSARWLPESRCAALRALLDDAGQDPPDPEDQGDTGEFGLRPVTLVPGAGHGLVGLTSEPTFPGFPHELAWDATTVDSERVCLYLLPDDREGDRGAPALSPVFAVADGFAATPPSPAPDTTDAGADATATADTGTD